MGISTNLTFIKKVVTRTKRGKVSDTSEASQPRHDHWMLTLYTADNDSIL
jgi:hypothetical protein